MLKLFLISVSASLALSAGLPGGKEEADVNSHDIKTMATFAVSSLNAQPLRNDVTLVHVLKAERQVVSGMNYFLELEVTDGSKSEICKITIYDQPWTHTREVSSSECQEKTKRQLGGVHTVDIHSIEVQNAAKAAVVEINKQSNAMYASALDNVIHATVQVVSGMKYNLEFAAGQTSCRNTPTVDLTKCTIADNSMKQTCTASIVFQAWMKTQYTLIDGFHCH